MKLTKKCYGCKQDFRREELVDYASPAAKTMQSYCPKCLAEKQARERFASKVCEIFGLKKPSPRIWADRKRLIDTYGYTDDILIDCLHYLYEVEKVAKLSESLCLIKPSTVERMVQYKKQQEYQSYKIVNAINTNYKEYMVPVEKKKERVNAWDPDEWLDDE